MAPGSSSHPDRRFMAFAKKRGWRYAVLGLDLSLKEGLPSRGVWRGILRDISPVRKDGGLSVTWPKGKTGATVSLGGQGWLIIGPFGRGEKESGAASGADLIPAMAGMLADATEIRERLTAATATLDAVLRLGRAFADIKDLKELIASTLVPELVNLLKADRGSVFLIDEEKKELFSVVAMGVEFREIRFPTDRGLSGFVARTGRKLNIKDAYEDSRFNPEVDRKTGYRTKTVLAVPMTDPQGHRFGVVQVINKLDGKAFGRDDEELLMAFTAEASTAIINARLVEEQRELFDSAISAMAAALDARDQLTAGHTQRVTEYGLGIGRSLSLAPRQLRRLRTAAMLHDLGKIGTPDAVLKKPGSLTPEEFEIIKRHAAYTRTIVHNLRLPADMTGLELESSGHHERMDGSGYPDGVKGDRIPLVSRILAVADVFDAITSKRHYREAMPIEQALDTIRKGSGSHFDPRIIEAFLRYFEAELRPRFAAGTDAQRPAAA
jgi:HD-GYP domain-containing protein (c-di-GMP phosphodiesterase class II)